MPVHTVLVVRDAPFFSGKFNNNCLYETANIIIVLMFCVFVQQCYIFMKIDMRFMINFGFRLLLLCLLSLLTRAQCCCHLFLFIEKFSNELSVFALTRVYFDGNYLLV